MKFKWKHVLAAALSLALALSLVSAVYAAPNEEETFAISFSRVADLTVFVDGKADGTLSQSNVVCGETIRLTAPTIDGKNFSHWAFGTYNKSTGAKTISSEIASTRAKYNFTLNGDTVIFAVYSNSAHDAKTCISFSSVIKEERMDNEYIRLTASYSLPDSVADIDPATDFPLSAKDIKGEVGIRYTTNSLLGVSNKTTDLIADPVAGINVEAALKSENPGNSVRVSSDKFYYAMGDWALGIKNPGNGVHVYAVAYVTYNGQTVFSEVKDLVYSDLAFGGIMNSNMSAPFMFTDNVTNSAIDYDSLLNQIDPANIKQ